MANGIDPSEYKKAVKSSKLQCLANSFEVICREWLENKRSNIEEAQYKKALARLEKDVFPWMGKRAIAEISSPEVLAVLRRIDDRGARHSAHKVKSEISQCFRYAIATGRAERDPCPDLKGAIPDALGTAYNRTKFLKERKAMMQLWADYLEKLKSGAEVIPLHGSTRLSQ